MIDIDSYVLEVVLKSKFLEYCGDIVSRDGDLPALDESGLLDNLLIGEICIYVAAAQKMMVNRNRPILILVLKKPTKIVKLFHFSEAAVAAGILLDRGQQTILSKIRPKCVGEDKLGIGGLPEHVVADALLA